MEVGHGASHQHLRALSSVTLKGISNARFGAEPQRTYRILEREMHSTACDAVLVMVRPAGDSRSLSSADMWITDLPGSAFHS